MKRYRFEVREEFITSIEVLADSEDEARKRVFQQGKHATAFDTVRGDQKLVLRSVESD